METIKNKKPIKDKISTKNLNLWFGTNHVLKNISVSIKTNRITAIIGPSGCGKTTLIRTFNRMSDVDGARVEGEIFLDGRNILDDGVDVVALRKRVGMVFQKPNPFPKSVFENVAYGPKIHGIRSRQALKNIIKDSLERAALWDEVKTRLNDNALGLSGGQQQRLCIARTLAVEPDIMLMDEPCSALDPIATAKIEDLMHELKNNVTIVIVTHNMQQAARVSDFTAFLYMGELIEYGPTTRLFENPQHDLTENYIAGRFG
ncbi:MAG: phosphate ABC transporter ATP-binding protein PstB [Candidatus Hodarchaeota archaeon]